MPRPALSLAGQTFGLWTAIERTENIGAQSAYLCKCSCGAEGVVRSVSLKSGKSRSCGCAGRKKLGNSARKHGLHGHHLYGTWRSMHERCRSPKHVAFHRYGGRGIAVCDRWSDFTSFLADMERGWRRGLSLDRIDNDGHYSPENCRWATPSQQTRNRAHPTSLTFEGRTQSVTEWARELGIRPALISQRLSRGHPVEKALKPPTKSRRPL